MISRRFTTVSVAALAILACAEPTAPPLPQGAQSSILGSNHRAVGSGHVEQATGMREFTFHALEQPDGSAQGSFKVVLANGLFFEADVTCLAVAGNTGWVGGLIRASNAAAVIIGSVSTFYVIDNGEASAASPDIVSNAVFNGAAGADAAFCAARPLALPPLTVTQGNVQVQ
jgi:hypothetical protein